METMKKMIYIATPYSKFPEQIRELVFDASCSITSQLMAEGLIVFAPIAHSHPIAKKYKLPFDWAAWEEFDRRIISVCDELWILQLPSWSESVGVQAEIEIAQELNIPVVFINPGDYNINVVDFKYN